MNQQHDNPFQEIVNGVTKNQQLIIEMEGDSALITDSDKYCSCSPDIMNPSNNARRKNNYFLEPLCLNCDLWISEDHMDNYNRAFGYSGYDEMEDQDE